MKIRSLAILTLLLIIIFLAFSTKNQESQTAHLIYFQMGDKSINTSFLNISPTNHPQEYSLFNATTSSLDQWIAYLPIPIQQSSTSELVSYNLANGTIWLQNSFGNKNYIVSDEDGNDRYLAKLSRLSNGELAEIGQDLFANITDIWTPIASVFNLPSIGEFANVLTDEYGNNQHLTKWSRISNGELAEFGQDLFANITDIWIPTDSIFDLPSIGEFASVSIGEISNQWLQNYSGLSVNAILLIIVMGLIGFAFTLAIFGDTIVMYHLGHCSQNISISLSLLNKGREGFTPVQGLARPPTKYILKYGTSILQCQSYPGVSFTELLETYGE